MEVYIQGKKTKISSRENCFIIKDYTGKEKILSTDLISTIVLENECTISSKAIILAVKNSIPITIIDTTGKVIGKFWDYSFSKNSILRKNQYKYLDSDYGVEIVKKWLLFKINSQIEHLQKIEKYRKNLSFEKEKLTMRNSIVEIQQIFGNSSEVREKIMGYEGVASRSYYTSIQKSLPERWNFSEREYQNSKNPYNLVLNYLFGILYIKCEVELVKYGLDPYVGILHSDQNNKKSLLYDYIEQYRIIAWEIAYTVFSRKLVALNDFEEVGDRVEIS
ncbi:MAG: CRISPR-associated endonuclease Cas1, partial [Cetobacterium sp.]